MAKNLSTVKVSGTSTEKTNFESTLTTADAGFEISIVGGDTYQWNGSAFKQITTSGAYHATPTSDPNGNYPANNFTDLNPAATTAAAAFTITGLQGMHSGQFNFTLTTETILLEALDSSGNNLGAILVQNISVATIGATVAATALAAGAYKILPPFAGAALRCTKSAAVNSITFNGFMSGAS